MAAPTYNGEVLNAGGTQASSTTVTLTISHDVVGNCIALGFLSASIIIISIADSRGNSWAVVGGTAGGSTRLTHCVGRMDYKLKAGDTVTVTMNSAITRYCAIGLDYSNANLTTTSVDAFSTAAGTSVSPSSGASGATTVADEIVIGFTAWSNTALADWSAGAGYTSRGTKLTDGTNSLAAEDKTVSATGAQTGTASLANSATWVQSVMAIRGSTRWYVDYNKADDTGAGTSWATAKKNISAAPVKSGDTVWVAKSTDPAALTGTMTFTDNSTSVATSADLSATLAAKDIIGPFTGSDFMADPWQEVSSVTASTITLSAAYVGTTRTSVTGYRCNGFDAGSPANSSISTWATPSISASSLASPVTIIGGYNTSNDTRDGITHMHVTSASRNGKTSQTNGQIIVSYLMVSRHAVAWSQDLGRCEVANCALAAFTSNAITVANTQNNTSIYDNITVSNSTQSSGTFIQIDSGTLFKNSKVFGNTNNSGVSTNSSHTCIVVDNCTVRRFNAGIHASGPYTTVRNCTSKDCNTGIENANYGPLYVNNCTFSGNATADVKVANTANQYHYNCSYSSTTTFVQALGGGRIYSDRHNQAAGAFRTSDPIATFLSNTGSARTGTCLEIQPSLTTPDSVGIGNHLVQYATPIPVDDSGNTRTVTVYVKTSSTWNGLVLRVGIRRHFQWIASQMVDHSGILGIAQANPGTTWTAYTFTYTMSEKGAIDLCVECDGTAGSVYVDDLAYT